jgi:hypothetical protein
LGDKKLLRECSGKERRNNCHMVAPSSDISHPLQMLEVVDH